MKKLDLNSLKSKSIEDLLVLVNKGKKELVKIQLGKYVGGQKNTQVAKAKKKEIARILTIISEKRIIQSLKKDNN